MISAIVAIDNNYGIGYKNGLLCHIKEDLKHFKEVTSKNIVIMGRKTWDSLPKKPLSNRINIVITNNKDLSYYDPYTKFVSLDKVKFLLKELGEKYNFYIIGGSQIYEELLPYCEYIHVTRIYKSFDNVDTYFPELKDEEWDMLDADELKKQDDINYQFCLYKRKVLEDINE